MSLEEDDFLETGSDKPVKRVRFSDEFKEDTVSYQIFASDSDASDGGDTHESKSIEAVQSELIMKDVESVDQKPVTQRSSSYDCPLQNELPIEKCYSVNSIIIDTALMTISPEEETEESDPPRKCFLMSNKVSAYAVPSNIDSEQNVSPSASKSEVNQSSAFFRCNQEQPSASSCKRRRKQSSELYSSLRRKNPDIKSADELKTAFFNAWCEIKNEKSDHQEEKCGKQCKQEEEKKVTPHETLCPNKNLKRPMRKAHKKLNNLNKYNFPDPVAKKTKEEEEESKMAFLAWKKKKDEIMKHQVAEKYRKEEKIKLDKLMSERVRKNDAEAAYSAWCSNKTTVFKMEKKKNEWLLHKKQQQKVKREDVVDKAYYDWLINKVYSPKINSIIEDKPPWLPPGKLNGV